MIKRPNLRIHEVEEAKIKTNAIQNIFNEITTENFSNTGQHMDIDVHKAFIPLSGHEQKRTFACHIIVKMPRLENMILEATKKFQVTG
jgi:hypothetical protein